MYYIDNNFTLSPSRRHPAEYTELQEGIQLATVYGDDRLGRGRDVGGTSPGVQRKTSPHFRNYVMTATDLDQLRCSPALRDVGTEEKRERFVF